MDDRKRKGYAWAISAGFCAAMRAISAKLSILQWVSGALLIVIGVFILSKSGIEKVRTDLTLSDKKYSISLEVSVIRQYEI